MSDATTTADGVKIGIRLRQLQRLLGLAITDKGEIVRTVGGAAVKIRPDEVAYDLMVAAATALFASAEWRSGERPEGEPKSDVDFVRALLAGMTDHLLGEDMPAALPEELRQLWRDAVEESIPFLDRKRAAQSRIFVPGGDR